MVFTNGVHFLNFDLEKCKCELNIIFLSFLSSIFLFIYCISIYCNQWLGQMDPPIHPHRAGIKKWQKLNLTIFWEKLLKYFFEDFFANSRKLFGGLGSLTPIYSSLSCRRGSGWSWTPALEKYWHKGQKIKRADAQWSCKAAVRTASSATETAATGAATATA